MFRTINSKQTYQKLICLIFGLFFLFSVISAPSVTRIFLYIALIFGLFSVTDLKTIRNNFLNYLPYLIFTLICIFSYISQIDLETQISESPEIENIIALFILFVFLISWKVSYFQVMDNLIIVITIYLLISLPVHFFYLESTTLSAFAFFRDFEDEILSGKNTLGLLLSVSLPFCLFKLSRNVNIYNFLTVIIFNLAIFYTFSRAALICAFIGTFLLLISFKKNLLKASILSIVSSFLMLFTFEISMEKYSELKEESNLQVIEHSTMGHDSSAINLKFDSTKTFSTQGARFKYLKRSYEGFLEKPFFGNGLTTFRKTHEILDEDGEIIRKPVTHNDYAQVLYELGIFGLISFLSLFIFNLFKIYNHTFLKSDESRIMFIQLIVLAISLNSGNYLDHSIFWLFMGITLLKTQSLTNKQNGISK